MKTISKEELKARLDRSEPIQLVMPLGHRAYEQAHIPGSQDFETIAEAASHLSRDQEVVVYSTNRACSANYRAYYALKSKGFKKIANFPGGLEEWLAAGYPAEGSRVQVLAAR